MRQLSLLVYAIGCLNPELRLENYGTAKQHIKKHGEACRQSIG